MNIYDIAQEAGVSIATVSRVLNNKPNISPDTLSKVRRVLKKYNYTPNSFARGLVTNSMQMIGVLVEDIRNPQYTNTAYAIEQNLYEQGYKCLFCNVRSDAIESYMKVLAESLVDGAIIIGSVFMTEQTAKAIETCLPDHPVVMVNGTLPCPGVTSVLCDDRDGIMQCVNHLYDKGHRKIIFVSDSNTDSAHRKLMGYKTALFEHDLQNFYEIIHTEPGFHGGIEAGKKIVSTYRHGKDYTAIVCQEDLTALGCVRYLESQGISVPQDVAVTGFGKFCFDEVSSHTLTTVDTHLELLGIEAVRCLSSLLTGAACPKQIVLTPELLVGQTT